MDSLLLKNKKLFRGVTIAEVLIVVVIIAFLAMIAFWANRTQVNKGYDARRKSDIASIKVAIEEYEKDHDCYPLPELLVCNPGTGLQPYLEKIPCDPRTGASYFYDYDTSLAVCPKWYRLYASLDNQTDAQATPGIGPNGDFDYYSGSPNAPTPSAGGGGSSLFGCKSGVCIPVSYDPSKPGPSCDPTYATTDCANRCSQPNSECVPWK